MHPTAAHFSLQVTSLAGLTCSRLTELRLKGCGDVRNFKPLQACPALNNLDITLTNSSLSRGARDRQLATILMHLKPLVRLRHVQLQQLPTRGATLFSFHHLLKLERPPDALGISAWKAPLTTLSLAGCSSLQDTSLSILQSLATSLTSLSLAKCRGLTGSGFHTIALLSRLVKLDLSECDSSHSSRSQCL
jgi:hypothetical protein